MLGSGLRPIWLKENLVMKNNERLMTLVLLVLFLPLGVVWSQSPDYSDSHNWIKTATSNKSADVFYVYPTVSADPSGYMDVDNEVDRGLAQSIYQVQASIFFDEANVYAPYYRQFSTGGATETPDYTRGQQDVKDAFQYYITNINPGLERPFILAGHSQGSRALKVLISDIFPGNALLAERLIAAYLIGETITEADLAGTGVTSAQGAADTGVVISFNTQAFGVDPGPMVSSTNALCINPLNWTTDGSYASSNLHRGAVIYDHETGGITSGPTPLLYFCDAQIDVEGRGLMAHIPEEWKSLDFGAFGGGVYHRYDYDFWYENLEENAGLRIAAYRYPATVAAVTELVEGYVANTNIVGLSLALVDSEGIVWSQGFGWADREQAVPTTGDTIYRLASLSKLFATIGVLREQEQGHLELDAPVGNYMTGFAPIPRPDDNVPLINYDHTPVTVRSMLCHLSGIQNAYTPYSETSEGCTNFLEMNIPSASTDYGCLPPDFLVCYNNNGFQFAEYLITLHNSDSLSYSDYIQRYLFDPLGMTHTGFDMDALAATGDLAASYDYAQNRGEREYMNCLGTGGALSSANDMARFLQMIMHRGSNAAECVLCPESVAAMLCDQTTGIGLYVGNKSLATGLGWDSAVLPDLEYAGGGCSKFGAIFTYGVYAAIATNHNLGVFVGLNTPQSDIATSVGNTLLQKAIEEDTGLTPPVAALPESPFAAGDHTATAESLAGFYVNGPYSEIAAGDNCLLYGGQTLFLRNDGWWSASNSPSFLLGFTNVQGCTFSIMKQPVGSYLETTVTGLRYTPPETINAAWSNRLDTLWLNATLPRVSYNRTHEGLIAGHLWSTNSMLMLTLPNIFLGQADKGFDRTSDYVIEPYSDGLAFVQGCGYTIPGGIQILDGGQRFRATNYEWQNTETMELLVGGMPLYFVPRAQSTYWFALDAESNRQYSLQLGSGQDGLFMFADANGHYLGESTASSVRCWICPEDGRYYVGIGYDETTPSSETLTLYADTDQVVVTATADAHGSVEPSGSFLTNRGANITFLFTADTYWDVDAVVTNGSESASAWGESFVWENLQTDSELQVSFQAECTSQGVPLWWLAQYGWTNEFEAAAASDPDHDGVPTWQEYPLGSCPTNSNTDGDQYDDGIEALSGADPTRDDQQTYGAVLDHPDSFGLYTTNNIGDLAFGCALVAVTSNQTIVLTLQPKVCHDLTTPDWSDIGSPVSWSMPAEDDMAFYRIEGFSGQ